MGGCEKRGTVEGDEDRERMGEAYRLSEPRSNF